MHDHAEHGVAAHWAYKEAGQRATRACAASGEYDAKIAVLRQLLAWERDLSGGLQGQGLFDDRIYVLTPHAAIVELPQGATPVDFAYTVHTTPGPPLPRCARRRCDGAAEHAAANGQTVEIIAAKEGGPSRDWLNAELGYLASHRARAKVRAWFNAQITHETVARGREAVEKLLQREGKHGERWRTWRRSWASSRPTPVRSGRQGRVFVAQHRDLLRPPEPAPGPDDGVLLKKARGSEKSGKGGVLVVGVSSLMTQLAKCCKPAPPDAIAASSRAARASACTAATAATSADGLARRRARHRRGVGRRSGAPVPVYAVDVAVEAADRQGLLRDISDVFAREKMNVIGVQTQSIKGTAWMTFTVEIADAARLTQVLGLVTAVIGVRSARRR
jgi:GTP pyrophosphokinase